jgi:hypothetical protein
LTTGPISELQRECAEADEHSTSSIENSRRIQDTKIAGPNHQLSDSPRFVDCLFMKLEDSLP